MIEESNNRIVEKEIMSSAGELNLDIIEVEIKPKGNILSIDVITDRPEGGITVGECTQLHRSIIQKIESALLIEGDFTIDVSSPGVDRPLITEKDFFRVRGHQVAFSLNDSLGGKKDYLGVVQEIINHKVKISFNAEIITIPLENINKAVQVL